MSSEEAVQPVNYMFYTRGSSDDWDEFARISGDEGWSWNKIFPYFLKSETLTSPPDMRNTTDEINAGVHGTKGPLLTSLPALGISIDSRVINTTIQLQSEFPFNLDMNDGDPLGVGTLQSTIGDGARSSAATAFLMPILTQRPNLDVLLNTHATKLVPTGQKGSTPVFRKVQFSQSARGPTFTITASKEILLTAGSIGTPQILMLSGIGKALSLKKLGIKTILNLSDVGSNLLDHPFVGLQWSVNSNNTNDALNHFPDLLQTATAQYDAARQGPLANNPGGSLELASADPFVQPLINPNMLAEDIDISILTEAVKAAQRFSQAPAWNGYINGPYIDSVNLTSDAAIKAYIRTFASSFNHVAGSAKISKAHDMGGVVGPDLKVKGAEGLRIVDASVL
ncbi:hypothetical protein C0991_007191, partial [Blastosporella zonata]